MADIKILYVNSDGLTQEHSESSDSVKLLSLKLGAHELTSTALGELIDSGDANDIHHHDGRYFRENEHIASTTGVSDADKPVKTDATGFINPLIDVEALAANIQHGDLQDLGLDHHTQYIRVDGTRAFTGAQSMGGFKLTDLANPTTGTDAVNLQTLQAYQQGLKPKEAVRVATVVAGTLATSFAAGQSVDGVTLVAGDRILIKDQASASENGIYIVQASGAPVRATDFDSLTPIDEINGSYTAVQEGTNAGKSFVQQGTVSTIGTDAINFVFFNASDSITASTGLVRVANDIQIASSAAGSGLGFASGVLSVNVDGASLEINADSLRVKSAGITDSMIAWGTGAGQVSAADMPIADAGNYFTIDLVENAIQDLALAVYRFGVPYTSGGVTRGDLVYVSANNTVLPLSTLSANEHCVGLAALTAASGVTVRALGDNQVMTGVLTGAIAGDPIYWTGSGFSATAPSTSGANVWQVGVAKNATDLHVRVRQVKKNS